MELSAMTLFLVILLYAGTLNPTTVIGVTDLNVTMGCYTDSPNPRDLPYLAPITVSQLTPTYCSQRCYKAGYLYAGAQVARQCFCGNAYGKYGSSTKCNKTCPGDATRTQICGSDLANTVVPTGFGANRMTVLYRDSRLSNASMTCSPSVSNVQCVTRCLRNDVIVGCTALQYDSNSRQCCLINDRYSTFISIISSSGFTVWVVT